MFKALAAGAFGIIALIVIISANAIVAAVAAVALPAVAITSVILVCAIGAGAYFGVLAAREFAGQWAARRKMTEVEARYRLSEALVLEAQAHKTRSESETFITVAETGQQVYRTSNGVTVPLHLSPGRVNGRVEASPEDLQRWAAWQYLNASKPAQIATEQAQVTSDAAPEPVLPVLDAAQRLLIVGASDSGKSTLLKWLIQARLANSSITLIDPHSPSRLLGVDVIGAGRDYGAIEAALESLLFLMDDRYKAIARGDVVSFDAFERHSVVIDELTSICANIETAGEMLVTLLTESRKANIHLVCAVHSDDVVTLGLKGRGKMRQNFTTCRLFGGNGQPRRCLIDPAHKTGPDGKRLEPTEYALPGPFDGVPQVPASQLILDLPTVPTSDELRIIELLQNGASNYAICKELGWSRNNTSYGRIEAVKEQFADVLEAL